MHIVIFIDFTALLIEKRFYQHREYFFGNREYAENFRTEVKSVGVNDLRLNEVMFHLLISSLALCA